MKTRRSKADNLPMSTYLASKSVILAIAEELGWVWAGRLYIRCETGSDQNARWLGFFRAVTQLGSSQMRTRKVITGMTHTT